MTAQTNSSGLVAAYGFNEGTGTTVADASGNGNVGTISNAAWAASGKYGGALSFNGTNARVNIPNSASLQLSSGMTLEAWVNPSTTTGVWRDVIYKGDDNYYLEATSGNGGKPAVGGTFGGGNANAYGSTPLGANAWSYVAVTYDGATIRLYVNGTMVGSQAKTGAITSSTNQLQIGGDALYGQYFSGLIDEIRIYNTALSATAIQADMTTPVSGSSTTDTTPPSTPTALTTGAVGQTSITLSWNPSSDNTGVTGYRTYLNGNQVGTSPSTSYGYSNLSCGTGYTLGVAAVDAAGNVSGIATLAKQTAACSDTTPPSAPGTLTGTAASSTEIDLSWGAATDNVGVAGYQIWRCQGAGCTTYSQLTQTTGSTTTYKDLSTAPATTYGYEVRALDAAGNTGPYTNSTQATTPSAPPPAMYSIGGKVSGNLGNDRVGKQRRRRSHPERERRVHVRDEASEWGRVLRHGQDKPVGPELHRLPGHRHHRFDGRLECRRCVLGGCDGERLRRLQSSRWRSRRRLGRGQRRRSRDLVAGGGRVIGSGRGRAGSGDVRGRSVFGDPADLDAAVGRAVGRTGSASAEQRPRHVSRDLLLEQRQSSAPALRAERRQLDPARRLVRAST